MGQTRTSAVRMRKPSGWWVLLPAPVATVLLRTPSVHEGSFMGDTAHALAGYAAIPHKAIKAHAGNMKGLSGHRKPTAKATARTVHEGLKRR